MLYIKIFLKKIMLNFSCYSLGTLVLIIFLQTIQLTAVFAMDTEDENKHPLLSNVGRAGQRSLSVQKGDDGNERRPLLSKQTDLEDFSTWIKQNVLAEPETLLRQKVAKGLGIFIGISGCIVFFDLGKGLATEILNDEAINNTTINGTIYKEGPIGNAIFENVTGVASAIPIAILGSEFCKHIFNEWVTPISEEENKITKRKSCGWLTARRSAQITEGGLAIISAAPITYLTHKYYYPRIGYGAIALDTTAFIAKAVSDYWAMDVTGAMLLNSGINAISRKKHEDNFDSLQHKRFDLIDKLDQASRTIEHMDDAEASQVYQSWVTEQDNLEQRIFNPTKGIIDFAESSKGCQGWGRTAAGFVGGVVGAFSSACLVPLAEESMAAFLPAIGIHSPIANKACGWIAGVAAGSLMTYASKESFERFYDFFAALPKLCSQSGRSKILCRDVVRVTAAGGALVLGAYSSAPQAYLSMQYIGTETPLEIFTLVCSAVGPFAMDFWAIDSFFKGFIDQLSPKQRLLLAVIKVQNKILSLDRSIIQQLHTQLYDNKNVTPVKENN